MTTTYLVWIGAAVGLGNALGQLLQLFPTNTWAYKLGVFLCQGLQGINPNASK